MQQNKAITYSLLAHVRNTGTLIKGPLDIFIPLIKRTLEKLNAKGITKGKSIFEIKQLADEMYSIDFPLPVIKNILYRIASEVNQNEKINFQIFQDGAFIIKDYLFLDFEEYIQSSKKEIDSLEKFFKEFCRINNIQYDDKSSIFDFIDQNKIAISRYLSNSSKSNDRDFTVEAQFVNYFKQIPEVYDLIKRVYLGSIISSYLEYKTEDISQEVELVFDTNFIVSLLDLNTIESTHTCKKLMEVGKNLGYRFTVLQDTLDETKRLILKKAEHFDTTFLPKKINPEDIFNACERRKLNAIDLERIADNLEQQLQSFGISFVYETSKYRNLAKFSNEYEVLKKYRNSETAAIHDALAIYYVRDKRKKKIRDFEKVNCWFVNNSTSHEAFESREFDTYTYGTQVESIKAEELLNILWLSNPAVNTALSTKDLGDIGLTSLVAVTLNSALPKASIIRELDDNIQKYATETLTDRDILLISTRIVNRQLKDITEINSLAKKDKEQFVNRLRSEVAKQQLEEKEKAEKLNQLFEQLKNQYAELENIKKRFEHRKSRIEQETEKTRKKSVVEHETLIERLNSEKAHRMRLQNEIITERRNAFINKKIKKWRRANIIELAIAILLILVGIVFIMWYSNWDFEKAKTNFKSLQSNFIWILLVPFLGIIFSAYLIPSLLLKYRNHSNIEAFTRKIKIPDDLKNVEG